MVLNKCITEKRQNIIHTQYARDSFTKKEEDNDAASLEFLERNE